MRGALVALGAHAEIDVEQPAMRQVAHVAGFFVPVLQAARQCGLRRTRPGLRPQQQGIDPLADAHCQDPVAGLCRFERGDQQQQGQGGARIAAFGQHRCIPPRPGQAASRRDARGGRCRSRYRKVLDRVRADARVQEQLRDHLGHPLHQ